MISGIWLSSITSSANSRYANLLHIHFTQQFGPFVANEVNDNHKEARDQCALSMTHTCLDIENVCAQHLNKLNKTLYVEF